jgi:DNA end-binding protein Ku
MARPTWKGHISFGLVNVPVTLYPADQHTDLSFHLLDSENSARVRYQRVNEQTGQEVPWERIVKAYEYENGNYIVLSEEELEQAAPQMTKRIEIEQFVDLNAIDVRYFEKPYVLVPDAGGEKGYVLLRDAMGTAKRVGIARVVIRSRGYLAALLPHGDALMLELLRFPQELRDFKEFDLPSRNDAVVKTSKKELDLAVQLVDSMTSKWKPDEYQDDYRDALMKLIERRIKTGKTVAGAEPAAAQDEEAPTVNFMDMLRRSVAKTAKKSKPAPAKPKKPGRRHAG